MVKSTYISANLTDDQKALLQTLDDHEVLYFSLSDLEQRIDTALSDEYVQKIFFVQYNKKIFKKTPPDFQSITKNLQLFLKFLAKKFGF